VELSDRRKSIAGTFASCDAWWRELLSDAHHELSPKILAKVLEQQNAHGPSLERGNLHDTLSLKYKKIRDASNNGFRTIGTGDLPVRYHRGTSPTDPDG
jgi:hypothetical protein